jgi:3-oxo-5alpha-steroid 4-dehydrogenase
MISWLERNGVPFEGSLCPYKTSYPNDYYLYYSGSEAAGGFREAAKPAARGHRAKGPGTSGKLVFARLAATVPAQGCPGHAAGSRAAARDRRFRRRGGTAGPHSR